MARQVSVESFQAMQRGDADADPFTIDPAAEDAAATERLKLIGAPVNRKRRADGDHFDQAIKRSMVTAADQLVAEGLAEGKPAGSESSLSGEAAKSEPAVPDAMTRLVAREMPLLNVGAQCSEEMSLGMVVDRVREAVLATDWGKLATDAEIVAEAERIWGNFSVNRKGPREYDVNPDGTLRDWRRPDTTPDRGDDVAEQHVYIRDEDGNLPRFSGGGTISEGERPMAQCIPQDIAFNGKLYRDAPELANIAEQLIAEKAYLEHLEHCEIRFAWRRKSSASKRRRQTGGLKRGSDWFGQLLGADFGIFLAADTARDRRWTPRHVERYLLHQLLRIGQDDHGNFVEQAPTLQVFAPEITEYADVADEDDKIGRSAFQAAEQIGLWVDDEGPVDDGSGIQIHADGSPLTQAEIEEQEVAEARGEEDDEEIEAADPDSDYDAD